VHNGTTYDYQYYLGDHLGNTRITFNTKTGTAYAVQQDDYYPFGMEILRGTLLSNKNEYLYNKKELQEEFSEYDYGARFYDPVIGRWTMVDPLAEVSRRWSPYNYVEDNPIRFTDPDGMETEEHIATDENRWASEQQAVDAGRSGSTSPESGFEDHGEHATGDGHDCCQTKPDHTAGKPAPKDPSTFSKETYETRLKRLKKTKKALELAADIVKRAREKEARENLGGRIAAPTGPEAVGSIFDLDDLSPSTVAMAGIAVLTDGGSVVEQYSLRATVDGFYPVMERGFGEAQELTWLNKGDLWKFGTTKNPLTRYSQTWLREMNLRYQTEFSGTLNQALQLENMKIRNYIGQNGFLPAGNKIIR